MKTPHDADVLFGEIRPEGSILTDAEKLEYKKKYLKAKRDQKKAMALATGEKLPKEPKISPYWQTKIHCEQGY